MALVWAAYEGASDHRVYAADQFLDGALRGASLCINTKMDVAGKIYTIEITKTKG